MKNLFLLSGIAMLFLIGCSSSRTANQQIEDNVSGKYWKLVTLEGKKVTMVPNQQRENYFTLNAESKTINGFSGCNSFSGTYSMEKGWRIRFTNMASTMMACPDVNINESEYLKVFELADNYTIVGDTLSLNVGRRAPLAVFEAVYLK